VVDCKGVENRLAGRSDGQSRGERQGIGEAGIDGRGVRKRGLRCETRAELIVDALVVIDPIADAHDCIALRARFPGVPLRKDILSVKKLPKNVHLITAGFPCQDLSPVGKTAGVNGKQFKLVWEVFRLIDEHPAEFVLFENVPFMLRLKKGRAIDAIVTELENEGFKWAYRTIDSQSFGLPQRRPRVFLLAARTEDPRTILLSDEAPADEKRDPRSTPKSFGFYWTEGNRGTGWALECLPALKGGSALGIPSAPAMILPSGLVATPHLCDAERLQGFPDDWHFSGGKTQTYRQVGNAFPPPFAYAMARSLKECLAAARKRLRVA